MKSGDRPSEVRFWQVGLGPVGRMLASRALERGWTLVGASDPSYAGESLGEVLEGSADVSVDVEAEGVSGEVDVALVATVSDPVEVAAQIEGLVSSVDAVVTTCEELAHPEHVDAAVAERLDAAARDEGARVLAAGVNPGFAMDLFPLLATGASSGIEHVDIVRRADVSERRTPLQRKVGAGLSEESFERKFKTEGLGHRGTEASMRLVASALGHSLAEVVELVRGVVAERAIETEHVEVEPGEIRGVEHEARGYLSGEETPFIESRLVLAVGVREPVDRVEVSGRPELTLEVDGGLPGDVCTVNVALNYVGVLLDARPGLYDVTELPVPRPGW